MDKDTFWTTLCAKNPSMRGKPDAKVELTKANLERLVKHAFDQGYVEGQRATCEHPAVNNFLAGLFGKKKKS